MSADLADLLQPEYLADPHPFYREVAAGRGPTWIGAQETWVVTDHAQAMRVLTDSATFRSDPRAIGEDLPAPMLSVQSLDGAEHAALRRTVLGRIRGHDLAAIEERAVARARQRVANLRDGRFDVVPDLVQPLALAFATEVLGLPRLDLAEFVPISTAIVAAMDAGLNPAAHEPGVAARAALSTVISILAPEPPLAGNAPPSGHGQLVNSLRAVLHASFESCARFLTSSLLHLATVGIPPGTATRDAALHELARFVSPVQGDTRFCADAVTVDGVRMPAGSAITVLVSAANRDPRVFAEPDRLLLDRRPNPHLAFGRGPHACLGTGMAFAQTRALLLALDQQGLRLEPLGEPTYHPHATLRGIASLTARLTDE